MRIARNSELLHASAGGEVMIMSVESANYFGLDPIGRRIWELTAETTTITEICLRLRSEYDVAPEVCQADVLAFLGKLAEHRIIDVVAQ